MNKTVETRDDLIKNVVEVTGATEGEAVERAVKAYVQRHGKVHACKSMFDLVGEVQLREDYDYKALRAGDVTD
jgi:hypothetical protein